MTAAKLYLRPQHLLVTATGSTRPAAGRVTMADSFQASIAAFRDWLPYSSGRHKGASTIRLYTKYVTRLAG